MALVKVVKNRSYFARFQVKPKRRRHGKTDYRARKRLTVQDKNKYNTPKYRLIVRFTNKDIVAQVAYSRIVGDFVVCSAYAHELPKYGIKVGLTNYAAAYATGLLLARRLLKQKEIDTMFKGQTEVDGEDYNEEEVDGRRPFKAVLDVGLARTSTGAKVFAVMKGVTDGGVDVPHSETRFIGYDREAKKYDAEAHRDRIFGKHVSNYMKEMQEEDEEAYKRHFSRFIAAGLNADNLEEMYKKAHDAIRSDPAHVKAPAKKGEQKRHTPKKFTYDERKQRVAEKKKLLLDLKTQMEQA